MIDLDANSIDIELFSRVLTVIKNRPEHAPYIIDSFSRNQFKSKSILLKYIDKLEIPDNASVVILGCWYGSILIPVLLHKFENITGIDLDSAVINCASNTLFSGYNKNVDFIAGDIFSLDLGRYKDTSLVINTSCEHMAPMNTWSKWDRFRRGTHFAFQSNNMFGIEGHINCVDSIEEFKKQIPTNVEILFENELLDDRGTRFTLVGKII